MSVYIDGLHVRPRQLCGVDYNEEGQCNGADTLFRSGVGRNSETWDWPSSACHKGVGGAASEWFSFVAAITAVHEVHMLAEGKVDTTSFAIDTEVYSGAGERVTANVPPTLHRRYGGAMLRLNLTASQRPLFVRAVASEVHSVTVITPSEYHIENIGLSNAQFSFGNDSQATPIGTSEAMAVLKPLQFLYEFFGIEYSQVWVSPTGYVAFEEPVGPDDSSATPEQARSALIACGGVFDDASVTVTSSVSHFAVRWVGRLFASRQASNVSLVLSSDGSATIRWDRVALSRGGSLGERLACWLQPNMTGLSLSGVASASAMAATYANGRAGAATVVTIDSKAFATDITIDVTQYFAAGTPIQHFGPNHSVGLLNSPIPGSVGPRLSCIVDGTAVIWPGAVIVGDEGICIGRPDSYGANEYCTITVSEPAVVSSCPIFDLENSFDYLQIDSRRFTGFYCPVGVELSPHSAIHWQSDSSVQLPGWQICIGPVIDPATLITKVHLEPGAFHDPTSCVENGAFDEDCCALSPVSDSATCSGGLLMTVDSTVNCCPTYGGGTCHPYTCTAASVSAHEGIFCGDDTRDNTRSTSTGVPAASLMHEGEQCWDACGLQQGPCSWCGSGLCCKLGWADHRNGCDGSVGLSADLYLCSPSPTTGAGSPQDSQSVITNRSTTCVAELRPTTGVKGANRFLVAIPRNEGTTIAQARSFCQSHYTELASIQSADELHIARDLCSHVSANNSQHACFIGLHKTDGQGRWEWADGSLLDWQPDGFAPEADHNWAGFGTGLDWHYFGMSHRAQTIICEDAVKKAVLLAGESVIRLEPLTLGGWAGVSLAAWIRLGQDSSDTLIFESYQRTCSAATEVVSSTCKAAGGWFAFGQGSGSELFFSGVAFEGVDHDFWAAAQDGWIQTSFVVADTYVTIYVDGVLSAEGTLEPRIPRLLREENLIGSNNAQGPAHFPSPHLLVGDFKLYDRGLAKAEAVALYAEPFGECCVSAGLTSGFGPGSIDLSTMAMAAMAEPSAVTARPETLIGNGTSGGPMLQPCSQSEETAHTREVDICSDLNAIESCNGILSDGVGSYPGSADCGLRLQSYRGGHYTLTFEEFETEAGRDWLRIYDGASIASPMLGEFSGNALPARFVSRGPELYISFSSNDNSQAAGFRARFACGGEPVRLQLTRCWHSLYCSIVIFFRIVFHLIFRILCGRSSTGSHPMWACRLRSARL
eukprot:SAG22_NODE_33_length_27588_cov_104.174652_4_plen_1217_part_00